MMRAFTVSLACLALAGCNLVHTSKPLIGPSLTAPKLREGLWARQDKGCVVDPAKPAKTWPACADAFRVAPDGLHDLKGGKPADAAAYRFSPGEPWLIQVAPRGGKPKGYFYAAIDPTARDPQGRITALSGWVVACGPVAKGEMVTAHPFPGLTKDRGKNAAGCSTTELSKLRAAARLSRTVSEVSSVRWIRDAEH